MSLPKEPRQLMVNLMYLVLTALLVLNVSAEVMNAFFDLDNSFKKSIQITNSESKDTWRRIQKSLESKKKLAPAINQGVEHIDFAVDSLVEYIASIQTQLIDETGNQNGVIDEEDSINGKPKGSKNKDVSNRLLINEKGGEKIRESIIALKRRLSDIYKTVISDKEIMAAKSFSAADVKELSNALFLNLPLYVETPEEIQKKSKDGSEMSWSEYKFHHMPLAAVLPILSKIQNDAEISRSMIMSKFANLTGGNNIKLNNFFPVIVPEKAYVTKGETFKARVTIGAYSNEFANSSSVYVNNQKITIGADGWGDFSQVASRMGVQELKLQAKVYNPHSKESFEEFDKFVYEVGSRSAAVSAAKMNLLYIGVENPLDISVAGVNSNTVQVDCEGCNVLSAGGKYIAKVTKPGMAKVFVSGEGFPKTAYEFRVKRIPDPLPKIGNGLRKYGGKIGNGEFKISTGVDAYLKDFDFDAVCNIVGYTATRHKKNDDPVSHVNSGSKYNSKVKRMVEQARPGDDYYFDEIVAKCPGDVQGRKLPSLVFKIR